MIERKKEIYIFTNELIIPYSFYIFAYMINKKIKMSSPFLNTLIETARSDVSSVMKLFFNRAYYSLSQWALDSEDENNNEILSKTYQNEIINIYNDKKLSDIVLAGKKNKFFSLFENDSIDGGYLYDKIYFVTNDSFLPTHKSTIDYIHNNMKSKKYEFIEYSQLIENKNIYNISLADPFVALSLLMDDTLNILELFMLDSNFIKSDKDKLVILSGYRNTPLRFIKTTI